MRRHAATAPPDIQRDPSTPLSPLPPHFAAKAKRVIYLHMGGSPSQLELFDHKPDLTKIQRPRLSGVVSEGQALCLHHRRAED